MNLSGLFSPIKKPNLKVIHVESDEGLRGAILGCLPSEVRVEQYQTFRNSVDAINKNKYDLMLINPFLKMDESEMIGSLSQGWNRDLRGSSFDAGLYLMKLVRVRDWSIPILSYGSYAPNEVFGDNEGHSVEQRALSSGAMKYIGLRGDATRDIRAEVKKILMLG